MQYKPSTCPRPSWLRKGAALEVCGGELARIFERTFKRVQRPVGVVRLGERSSEAFLVGGFLTVNNARFYVRREQRAPFSRVSVGSYRDISQHHQD
jgi:hypothetical protein